MGSPQYDDNLLTQYLLGGLSEAQVEEFDELSIIDDEFASQLGEVENDLIDAYVRGEMTGQARAQFESRYLTSPRRREKVKFAQSLQIFAETKVKARKPNAIVAEAPAQETHKAASESVRPAIPNAVPWWQGLFTVPSLKLQWGLAVGAMLLLIVGGWFLLETLRLREQSTKAEAERARLQQRAKELQAQLEAQQSDATKESEQLREEMKRIQEKLAQRRLQQIAQQRAPVVSPIDPKIVSFTLAPQTRGPLAKVETITIPPGIDYVTLNLKLETDDFPAYRAELRTQPRDEKVWSSGKLRTRNKGGTKVIAVNMPADKLTTGGYDLLLRGIAVRKKLSRERSYYFRVVQP